MEPNLKLLTAGVASEVPGHGFQFKSCFLIQKTGGKTQGNTSFGVDGRLMNTGIPILL